MIPIIPKPDKTLDKINNFLSNKDLLIQTEKEYIHSIYNNFDDENFQSKLDNFKLCMLGYFQKDIYLSVSDVSRTYLVKILEFYFNEENYIYHVLYHTKLSVSNDFLYFISNLKLYIYDSFDSVYKYINNIYDWITKNKINFKIWNDEPIPVF